MEPWLSAVVVVFLFRSMLPYRHLLDHHAPEPEKSTAEPEPDTIMPEIMTNQEAFLMYGIFIFALAVFCVVLLVMYILLKKKVNSLTEKLGYGQGHMQMGMAEKKGYIA